MSTINKELKNATIEAIFWWKNIERFYHYQFKEMDSILNKGEDYQEFFILKFFNPFLKEYSVRRNIKKGDESVLKFLKDLKDHKDIKFFKDLNQKDKIDKTLIDDTSEYLKGTHWTNGKNCKSLLSKIAFTIRPDQFYIYDSLAKSSIREYRTKLNAHFKDKPKILSKNLDHYDEFYRSADKLKEFYNEDLKKVIKEFHEEIHYSCKELIKDDYKALKMRIIDKHLWIKSQEKNNERNNKNKTENIEFNTNNHKIYKEYNEHFPLYLKNKGQ